MCGGTSHKRNSSQEESHESEMSSLLEGDEGSRQLGRSRTGILSGPGSAGHAWGRGLRHVLRVCLRPDREVAGLGWRPGLAGSFQGTPADGDGCHLALRHRDRRDVFLCTPLHGGTGSSGSDSFCPSPTAIILPVGVSWPATHVLSSTTEGIKEGPNKEYLEKGIFCLIKICDIISITNIFMHQKLFRFEADQSVRVEELTDDTVIAIANNESERAIVITSRVKRRLLEHYRCLGKPKKFAPHVFAAGLILLIVNSEFRVDELVVDIEYPGYELAIIDLLHQYSPKLKVYFSIIGKKSPAHFTAYGIHKGKKKPDQSTGFVEILAIINKKRPQNCYTSEQVG